MAMGISLGNADEQGRPGRNIDWMPLLIVIGAVYLISVTIGYGTLSYDGFYIDYNLEFQINLILVFLASTILIATIALVVYSRVDLAKKMLIVGMVILILILAIRTEVYLRGSHLI